MQARSCTADDSVDSWGNALSPLKLSMRRMTTRRGADAGCLATWLRQARDSRDPAGHGACLYGQGTAVSAFVQHSE
jgi:hypothetical protein